MASLMEKVSTLISANLHDLVDHALQSNSVAVIDQYIRQVENNLQDLEEAAATVGGEAKSIRRRLDDNEQKLVEMDRAIDAFLMEGNESAAAAVQSRYNSTQRLVETYREQLSRQENEFKTLLDAKVKLEARSGDDEAATGRTAGAARLGQEQRDDRQGDEKPGRSDGLRGQRHRAHCRQHQCAA